MNLAVHLGLLALVFFGRPIGILLGRRIDRRARSRHDNQNGGPDQ